MPSQTLISNLTAKIQLLVNELEKRGLLPDGEYVFPDGDVWKAEDTTAQIRVKIKDIGSLRSEILEYQDKIQEYQRLVNLLLLHAEAAGGDDDH